MASLNPSVLLELFDLAETLRLDELNDQELSSSNYRLKVMKPICPVCCRCSFFDRW